MHAPISIFFTLMLLGVIVVLITLLVALWVRRKLKRDASRAGYASVSDYLRSPPRSDRERRDAIDLGLTGLVFCLLGFLFPPFLLVGVFPLFYGLRKIAYGSLGLGLIDDTEEDETSA
jgi:di/tricarboxylate transporter